METILVDINAFAINLVENHPGYPYIEPLISSAGKGKYSLKVLDIVPYRAFWIFTKKWTIEKSKAKFVIESFIQTFSQVEYFGLTRESIMKSFEYSKLLNHDIFDCYYLAAAVFSKSDTILTTDTDFLSLCDKLKKKYTYSLKYHNPIPEDVLKEFSAFKM